MKTLFLDAPYAGLVELSPETLDYLIKKGYKKVGLYASVQFVNRLEEIKKQLERNKIKALTSRPDRAHVESQLLGCNVHGLNLEGDVDCYLYVGDGKFHPLALVYSQKKGQKEVVCDDPLSRKMSLLSREKVKTTLKKYKSFLMKFLTAKIVGIIITLKPGQEHYAFSQKLKEKYPDKRFYYFIDNNISFEQLENFPFVDVWVNTACPRIALEEQDKFLKGVINLNDALNANEVLAGF
ncbi:MAG: 2-(3-amino-3-carboxypropyl)histidine synthase subunit [Nanoarchaeota archaeon]|nr:2-(3-amino-3-carboxypropyl)histidine synthase subunit [Nanoarchaeota archaeon]MBU1644555.1 2-(3-amino-3-carboxypropyl)histidine synthase subunit [Nanoarchaeota archaeon]MBU1976848.1 2-(3-amino-3-carboxypropyl)histidine synthase subunit [Nanoarchaeota archaeon]